jgi:hypothetical protein
LQKSVGKIEGLEQEKERKEERAADKEATEGSTRFSWAEIVRMGSKQYPAIRLLYGPAEINSG